MRAEADCDKPKPCSAFLIKEPPVVTASCVVGVPLEDVSVNIEGTCREQLPGGGGGWISNVNTSGNHDWVVHFGIIKSPVTLSWMIFAKTRGRRLNGGKA